jgi:hypothetical protein
MMHRPTPLVRSMTVVALLALAAGSAFAAKKPAAQSTTPAPTGTAATAPSAPAPAATPATPVTVERVRPDRDRLPSLTFLRANRDFIRARFDLLRERPAGQTREGTTIDPRYLAYEKMLADIHAARESVSVVDTDLSRQALFASVTELGRLETQLDQMDRLIGDQRVRLQALQNDFTGRQRTALMVVVSGDPGDGVVQVDVQLENGGVLSVPIYVRQREALKRGGVIEVFYGFVEPRDQVVTIGLTGPACPAGDRGYVTLSPVRDRLLFLKLDLSSVRPGQGAASIHASTWLHEARPLGDG